MKGGGEVLPFCPHSEPRTPFPEEQFFRGKAVYTGSFFLHQCIYKLPFKKYLFWVCIIDRFRQLSNEIWKLCWNYLKDPNMEKALLIIYPNETKLCRKFRTFQAFFEKKNPMAHKMCAFGAQIWVLLKRKLFGSKTMVLRLQTLGN